MPLIRETIVITASRDGRAHIAPIGLIAEVDDWIIAPFRPSTTLDNLVAVPFATASNTDDVRVFAGCLTGRYTWPTVAAEEVSVPRLADALSHIELAVIDVKEDPQRPRLRCRVVRSISHAPFQGFNRAQAAVLEAAILDRLFRPSAGGWPRAAAQAILGIHFDQRDHARPPGGTLVRGRRRFGVGRRKHRIRA